MVRVRIGVRASVMVRFRVMVRARTRALCRHSGVSPGLAVSVRKVCGCAPGISHLVRSRGRVRVRGRVIAGHLPPG